ncbi:MAG: hypothetical protein IPN19_06515 [Elusimicrobia bacterium]|nr:hypothetical protein [Elusimicrobiota bacterium]
MSKLKIGLSSLLSNHTTKDIFLLIGVYFLSYGFMLLNPGIYWDDWFISTHTLPDLISHWGMCGGSLFIRIHHGILGYDNAVLIFRLLIFTAYFLGMIFFYLFLKEIKILGGSKPFWLCLLISVYPVSQGRLALILTYNAWSYCFFALGLWLTLLWVRRPNLVFRWGALLSFNLSFFTNSFLVIYAVVPLLLLGDSIKKFPKNLRSICIDVLKRVDFFVLPLLFWLARLKYWSPDSGSGYNEIVFMPLQVLFIQFTKAFHSSFLGVFELLFGRLDGSLSRSVLFAGAFVLCFRALMEKVGDTKWKFVATGWGLLCVASYFYVLYPFPYVDGFPASDLFLIITCLFVFGETFETETLEPVQRNEELMNCGLILCGAFLFLLGVYPYIAVWKVPRPVDFDSRYELIVPFGAGFMVYGTVCLVGSHFKFRKIYNKILLSTLIIFFVGLNVRSLFLWQCDYYKQCAIMARLRVIPPPVFDSKIVVVDDETGAINAWGRKYYHYEWEGFIRFALNSDEQIGTDYRNFKWMDYRGVRRKGGESKLIVRNTYGRHHRPCLIITAPPLSPFEEQESSLSFPSRFRKDCLRLLWLELFYPEDFQKKIGQMLDLKWICTCEINEKNRHRSI